MFVRALSALSLVTLLAGCSQSYSVNSNLDKDRISDYFSSRSIDIYDRNDEPNKAYKVVSIITGDSCQRSRNDPPASAEEGRQQLRQQAHQFKADAIISAQCYSLPPDDEDICYSRFTCFGEAVQWRP